jgi:hypothetical protein
MAELILIIIVLRYIIRPPPFKLPPSVGGYEFEVTNTKMPIISEGWKRLLGGLF